ncbi:MAG TPA: DUF4124 domain-containing protein [Telluria sp.]
MNRILISTIVAACVASPVGLAQADIVKCTDAEGRVTLTDMPCANPVVVVPTDGDGSPALASSADWPAQSADPMEPAVRTVGGVVRITLAPEEFGPRSRREAYKRMSRPAPTRIFATDAATLRAAHTTLTILDSEPRRLASH